MSEDVETVALRGEGGAVQVYDLPLREVVVDQVDRGQLVPVDGDGQAVGFEIVGDAVGSRVLVVGGGGQGPVDGEDLDDDGIDGDEDLDDGEVPDRPTKRAKVAAWRSYAVALGADPDVVAGLEKDAIIALYPEGD